MLNQSNSTYIVIAIVALVAIGLIFFKSDKPKTPEVQLDSFSNTIDGTPDKNIKLDDIKITEGRNNQQQNGGNMPAGKSLKTIDQFEKVDAEEVVLTTSKGDITIELYTAEAPLTTTNFLNLVKDGFYDGIIIHRVEPNFVVQFGDPLTKEPGKEALWGTGGPGYAIADEFSPSLRHNGEGILSMANSGPNTGGSQVFITLEETPWLDDKHAVFGKVIAGMDIVKKLQKGDKIIKASYQ